MTPTRIRGLNVGHRMQQVMKQMARSGGRWPVGWRLRGGELESVKVLVRRGWVESVDNPVLTKEGRNIAFWL